MLGSPLAMNKAVYDLLDGGSVKNARALLDNIPTYRPEPNGSRTIIDGHMRNWYAIGTGGPPFPQAYYHSHQDGPDCRRAYLAGVIARAFGIDLSPHLWS